MQPLPNPLKIKVLDELAKVCSTCLKCDLSHSRTQTVFSDGNPNARILLIGEAPGQNEDETGTPFVGRAGKFLDKILNEHALTRANDFYICNTVKCRPPNNRVPTPSEKQACRVYLDAQINIIRPEVILLCGATAVKSMLDTKLTITKIRGQWFDGPFNSKMMPILHPSYLLRNLSNEHGKPLWLTHQDIEEVKRLLNSV